MRSGQRNAGSRTYWASWLPTSCTHRAGLGQVVPGALHAVGLVDDPHVGVAYLPEVLVAGLGVVDRHGDHHARDLGGHVVEVDLDRLVVALALTGEVVAGVLDRAV